MLYYVPIKPLLFIDNAFGMMMLLVLMYIVYIHLVMVRCELVPNVFNFF